MTMMLHSIVAAFVSGNVEARGEDVVVLVLNCAKDGNDCAASVLQFVYTEPPHVRDTPVGYGENSRSSAPWHDLVRCLWHH